MGEVVAYANNKAQCFCQVKLDSGERVMVSIASMPTPSIKVIRLGLLGLLPKETIWEYSAAAAGGTDTYVRNLMQMMTDLSANEPQHPLDAFRDRLLSLKSIAQVRSWFQQAQHLAENDDGNA